jgi:hypothetical protein
MEANEKQINDNRIIRAAIDANKGESYDFSAIAVPSQNGQLNYSYENGEYFMQVLRTGPENIDTSRLENGLPLFDNHPWDNSAANTLGITTAFDFTPEGLAVRCKFGARADEALRADVANGVVNTVSIEGRVQNYEIVRELGKLPVYYATLWTPESLSFAPVPNDIGAKIEVKRAIDKQLNQPKQAEETKVSGLQSIINKF